MSNDKTDFLIMEKTFTIIKPNAVIAYNIGNIVKIIEDQGFIITSMEMRRLSKETAHQLGTPISSLMAWAYCPGWGGSSLS